MMGLLDFIKDEYAKTKRSFGLLGDIPKTFKNNPRNAETMDAVFGLGGLLPGIGDVSSALEAKYRYDQGDMLGAGLAGLGALPMVPSMAGVITDIRPPRWNPRASIPVGINPTRSEILELLRDEQAKSAYNTLRVVTDEITGTKYVFPADAALHQDIGAHFNLNPKNTRHGLITPD